ncbi:hypothetical protein NDU88_005941 [Pleurodeles waltl]|uniref:Uncharacterized protein n=1 Tax=Pleurodeles waltl TaxID=8319 RepID=A0AAV7NRU4_PLEWA|nr:hypothetical protein NDU88_005941 [Pleurodeles waltl]
MLCGRVAPGGTRTQHLLQPRHQGTTVRTLLLSSGPSLEIQWSPEGARRRPVSRALCDYQSIHGANRAPGPHQEWSRSRGPQEALNVATTLRCPSNVVLWLPLEWPIWNKRPVSPGNPQGLQPSRVTLQQHERASSSPSNATCLQTPCAPWKQHERLALLCASG